MDIMEVIDTPLNTIMDPEPQLHYPACPHCQGKQGQLVSESGIWFSCTPCDGIGSLESDMIVADAKFCKEHYLWRRRNGIVEIDSDVTQKELQDIFSGYHNKVPFTATRLLFENPPDWTTSDLLAALKQIAENEKKQPLMVSVPLIPTLEMISAGCDAVDMKPSMVRKIYETMVNVVK